MTRPRRVGIVQPAEQRRCTTDRTAQLGGAGVSAVVAEHRDEGWQPVSRYGFTVGAMSFINANQAPKACTLPTVERPLRVGEFDRLFARASAAVERLSPQTARI